MVLLVIIAAAVMFWVKKSDIGGPKPPQWVLDQEVERIDSESLELITTSWGEWLKLGEKDGKYKNPNTKTYTMVPPIECAACGEKIPPPEMPAGSLAASEDEQLRILQEYKCPKCGEPATALGRMAL